MKHHINFIFVLLFPVLLSCSSSSDDAVVTPDEPSQPTPVDPPQTTPDVKPPLSTKWTFSYLLPTKGNGDTRAAGSDIQFDNLDASNRIGLFCLKSNGTFYFDNLKYKDGGDGTLVPDDGVQTPDKYSGTCKIIACAPYSEVFKSLPENITFPVQLDQTTSEGLIASDLLWAEANADAQLDNIEIEFQRILTRWVLNVSIGGGLQPKDFQGATLAIYNVRKQIGFNARTGEIDGNPSEYSIIKYLKIDDSNTASSFTGTVMLPPQDCKKWYLQVVFKDGVKYYFKFDPFTFRQHKYYYSNIQLTGYPNNIKAEIKSWEENDINGTITSETE